MRLTRLKVRNIASLRGEHIIDFKEVMNHSPLFAITGETGAGKSTILNAIGLALYGQIFKRTLIQNDVVTLGEKEGLIELIFEVKGKTYLASWRARVRKQNGEAYSILPSPSRELYTLEGEEFDSPRLISQEKSEDILHLDFDQFTKCVILNQGEFARFLMSSFTERKDILEKLYPGELLENLSRELRAELDHFLTEKNTLDIELKTLQEDGTGSLNVEEELKTSARELELHERWSELTEKLNYHFTSLYSYHQKNGENLKRIDSTKKELAAGTTTYNSALKNTEAAQVKRDSFEAERVKRTPRLQELLKAEETLKNEKRSLEEATVEELKYKSELSRLSLKSASLREEEARLLPEKQETIAKMKRSPEEVFRHRQDLEDLFETSSALDLLRQSAESEKEKLSLLEMEGKKMAARLQEIQEKLKTVPDDAPQVLKNLQKKKDDAQKTKARGNELENQLKKTELQISETKTKLETTKKEIIRVTEERQPVLASLKLQELLTAVSVCLLHPQTEEKNLCPVCETPFAGGKLQDLRKIAAGLNLGKLQSDADRLQAELVKLEAESALLLKTVSDFEKNLADLLREKEKLVLISEDELDKEIESVQKLVWDREQLLPQLKTTETELEKFRSDYRELKTKLTTKESSIEKKSAELNSICGKIHGLVPAYDRDLVPELKLDLRLSVLAHELDGKISRIRSELALHQEREQELKITLTNLAAKKSEAEKKVSEFTALLSAELKNESAAVVLKTLSDNVRSAQDELEKVDSERRKQELALKEFQSRLYTYDEQARDIEVQYSKEHKELLDLSSPELPELSESLTQLRSTMKKLDLRLESSAELFLPLKDLLEKEKAQLKTKTNEARSRVAHFQAIKETQEKKRDRIRLLELKREDVTKELNRRERLFDILGKDELRTYVLSLVEENLIIVTNDELSRLCQGRYEIIHQTKTNKLAPEFFILDKFRDGGIRKVSTLSGGETFMVSLAMALGLAEMTRGTAEIDTLFIDEGFGTLDQDSLEDVLDMLNQIQNRGLMVGIISHVKALTSTLPVNLNVQKRQDGTSSVRLVVN